MGLAFIFEALLVAGNVAAYPKLYKLPIWSFRDAESLDESSVGTPVFFVNALMLFGGVLILAGEGAGYVMGGLSILVQILIVHLPILFGPSSKATSREQMGGSESTLENLNAILKCCLGILVCIRLWHRQPKHLHVGDQKHL